MSVSQASTRGTDFGSLPNVLFPSSGSFRYASRPSEQDAASTAGNTSAAPHLVIWGTDVNVESCKQQFIAFLKDPKFTLKDAAMDEARLDWQHDEATQPLYLTKLEEVKLSGESCLTVNCAHLKEFDPRLCRKLIYYPNEVVQIFDIAANELFQELYPEHDHIAVSVRPFNIDQTYSIRGLNPDDIGKLITISGMVTRCSTIIPEMVRAFFKCVTCTFTKEVSVDGGRIEEPHVCASCSSKFSFELIHNRSKFVDRQLIKLQESPDEMPAGQTPSTVALVACADLVDTIHPGDRIFVTGIYRASSVRVHPRIRKLRSAYKTTIECIHFRKVKQGRLHDESSFLRFTPERIDRIKALAKDDAIYSRMAHSLCPSIFGHTDVKKGVLLQLLGGTKKETQKTGEQLRHFRSDVHILLCGDPGTSKSQILQYVHKLVPRGQYTSGKGSSAVGLTAYITRDVDTKQLVLQTGALAMCDGGICCIDEFDKMSDSTRSVLHEVMEQQTLSVAKAGIVCQLNARTSVLAAANPIASAWDQQRTVIDNIKLPDTLLSRFDLIFLLLDPNNEAYDTLLARHLISIYHGNQSLEIEGHVAQDLIKDYIAYARYNIEPRLTDDALALLSHEYVELRKAAETSKGRISVYPRNLESLIRLSEAHARLRLSMEVEHEDIHEAVRLTKEALKYSSTDPNTGRIGVEVILA